MSMFIEKKYIDLYKSTNRNATRVIVSIYLPEMILLKDRIINLHKDIKLKYGEIMENLNYEDRQQLDRIDKLHKEIFKMREDINTLVKYSDRMTNELRRFNNELEFNTIELN